MTSITIQYDEPLNHIDHYLSNIMVIGINQMIMSLEKEKQKWKIKKGDVE